MVRFNEPESRRKISAAQSCFTPCKQRLGLLEPMTDAAENAARDATILLSPARSSFDRFQNARNRGEKLYSAAESISWGEIQVSPNRNGKMAVELNQKMSNSGKQKIFASWFFEGKARGEQPTEFNLPVQKGRRSAKYNEQA